MLHPVLIRPFVEGLACKLGPVVGQQRLGHAVSSDELVEDTTYAISRQRSIRLVRQANATEFVENGQNAKAATTGQLIGHEVHGPSLVESSDRHGRHAPACCRASFSTQADLQAFLLIDTEHPLVIVRPALSAQQEDQASIAPATTAMRFVSQDRSQGGIRSWSRTIMVGCCDELRAARRRGGNSPETSSARISRRSVRLRALPVF